MPRKPRVEYEDAAYHVMCRGDHGEPICQDGLLGKHQRSSYSGPAMQDHQRRTAAELLAAGLEAVGLDPQELATTPKTDPRKQAVAWLLCKNTTVSNRWLSSQLNMGHEVNVSQAVRLVREAKAGQRARLRSAVAHTLRHREKIT